MLLENGLISCKCILQTLGQPLKYSKKKYNWYARRGKKMESYQIIKIRKEIPENKRNKGQVQNIIIIIINIADIS